MALISRREPINMANAWLPDVEAPEQLSLSGAAMPNVRTAEHYMPNLGDPPPFTPMSTQMRDTGTVFGFLDPAGLNQAQRQSAMGELNTAALQQAAQRQSMQQAAGYGGGSSGTALALQSQAGTNLAGQRAGLDASLHEQAIARNLAARQQAAGLGQQRAFASAAHDMDAYQTQGQFGMQGGQFDLARAQAMADDAYRRQMGEYEANVLLPYQTDVAMQLARAQAAAGIKAGRQQMAGSLIGGAMGMGGQLGGSAMLACWVAEELYGPEDIRTMAARFWAVTEDTWFNKLYRKYGKKWAKAVKKSKVARMIAKPIWDRMAVKGFAKFLLKAEG